MFDNIIENYCDTFKTYGTSIIIYTLGHVYWCLFINVSANESTFDLKTFKNIVLKMSTFSFRKLVIIFTRQEEYLRRENSSFEQFLRNSPPELKKLLKQCHYRCKGFNNMALIDGRKDENDKQVNLLLQLIDRTDSEDSSKYTCFTRVFKKSDESATNHANIIH